MSSTATWEEIKRLAADFQRVQLVESSYKLSERNCIEIVNKLIELGMINVLHSIDGKEFITEKHLEKEIYDELYVHEGRNTSRDITFLIHQTLLNVDISHIEGKVSEIVKRDANLYYILGQIISKDYMNKIAEEINEVLQEKGSVGISELTGIYELPTDFIQQIITPRVGSIIKGNFDGKMIYTHNFVNNQKALLAGALEACIKPIRISQLVRDYNLAAGMVFDIFDELTSSSQIKGILYGGRQEMSAVFVPAFYAKAQQQYVESFLKQNGYLEYSSLKKIGITEPDSYVKSLFENQNIKYLSNSCFASYYLDQIEEEIEETINRNGFCDISNLLPAILNEKDLNKLTVFYNEKIKPNIETLIFQETHLFSKQFLKTINSKFQSKMEEKAEDDLRKPNYVLAIKSDHAIVGGGSSIQTSSTSQPQTGQKSKSKGKKTNVADHQQEEIFVEIVFIDQPALVKELKQLIDDISDDIIEPLVDHFLKPLNNQYFDLLKTKIESGLISTSKSSGDNAASVPASLPKKNTMKEVQERIRLFLVNGKIFEKALKSFSDPKVQDVLSKHLIKTSFNEIINEMVKFIGTEQLISFSEENFNNETRLKIIQKLKEPHRQGFTELNQALNNKTPTEILELIEKVAVNSLELSTKKADPKKEKEVLLQIRESTKATLEKETDPATVLHLVSILVYYHLTGHMLNAPGRCVPSILDAIKTDVQEETFAKLYNFQNLIIENINKSKTENEIEETMVISQELIDQIRNIGLNPKSFLKPTEKN